MSSVSCTPEQGVCLVEDDEVLQRSLRQRFQLEGLSCRVFSTMGEALDVLKTRSFNLLLCDVRLPDGDCGEMFQIFLQQGHILPPTLFITGYPNLEQAVKLLRLGASDYIAKPFDVAHLLEKMRRLSPQLFEQQPSDGPFELGVSTTMRNLSAILDRLAARHVPVLITGESGVGKEYAARYLHQRRFPDNGHPFQALNCAALPENLMEAELFGFDRGAFTGAVKNHQGLIEQASGGTLLLDEVGEMPLSMQSKLLRVLQEKKLNHLGGEHEIKVDIDLISATNRDLRAMVEAGEFREDLFYRLHVVHIDIPPLRERPEDILWFAQNLFEREGRKNPPRRILSPAAESWLLHQPWPGNVRELLHVLERTLIFSEGALLQPSHFSGLDTIQAEALSEDSGLRDCLAESERWYIEQALEKHGWRMSETADSLKISRKNLWERMNRLNIQKPT